MIRNKVIIVDDEKLFRRGLRYILQSEPSIDVVASAGDGMELLSILEEAEHKPDVVLLDLKMANLNGIETTKILTKKYPEVKIAILSLYYSPEMVRYMVSLGVSAFLRKTINPKELKEAINKIIENGSYLTPYVLNLLKIEKKHRSKNVRPIAIKLTKREKEILELICKQFTNSQIAEKLFLSVRTIDGHRLSLLSKTNSKNTAGLVVYAIANNLVEVSELRLI
ncbi:MAG: response regulator transcription factor [Vicingaceae bacterium]